MTLYLNEVSLEGARAGFGPILVSNPQALPAGAVQLWREASLAPLGLEEAEAMLRR